MQQVRCVSIFRFQNIICMSWRNALLSTRGPNGGKKMKNLFSMRICFPGCEPHWFDNGYPCTIVSERSVQTHAARSLPIAQSDPERRYCFFFHRLRHHKFRFLRGSVEKAELMAGRKTRQGALAIKKKGKGEKPETE